VINSLNLASKPFSNRILPWALTAIILFVSLIGLIFVVRLTTNAKSEASVLDAEIIQLKQREHAALEAAKKLQQELSADQKQALPAAHSLVDRKAFSWSRLLADLETSLPAKVKVTRIAVREVNRQADQTVAQLDLAVFSQDPATVNAMISSMHDEGIFNAEIRNQNLQKGRGEGGTEYELFVIYRAPSSYASENVAKADRTGKGGDVPR
jgi:Tfp pilus assembly protein PilN